MSRKLELIKTEDGSHSLYVPELKETYHSFHGAVQESRHVFMKQGLDFYYQNNQPELINVLEVGLGTGLNALLTAEWSVQNAYVKMTSLEAYPVESSIASQLNYHTYIEDKQGKEWFDRIHSSEWEKTCAIHDTFDLLKNKLKVEEAELTSDFNVVFFDAFAPNKQSELWEMQVLEKMYDALTSSGVFVTYCAKGQLKRDLATLGFEVETLAGPPGKKEMVRGIKK
ncbi:MAG: tRNA (5-methylaminomethyl-2-thiouridine)(34)-methyltransferase MnmD [Fulvivirga sp.]